LVGIHNVKPNTISNSEIIILTKIDEVIKMLNKFLPKISPKKKKNLKDIYQEIKLRILAEKQILRMTKKMDKKNGFHLLLNFINCFYKENTKVHEIIMDNLKYDYTIQY
jgi:hypothetical protein